MRRLCAIVLAVAAFAPRARAADSAPAMQAKIIGGDETHTADVYPVNGKNRVAVDPSATDDSVTTTYAAAATNVAIGTNAQDVCTLTGSATKLVKVRRVMITGFESNVFNNNVLLVLRSTADSGGTSTTQTAVPFNSGNAAATAVLRAYTANPTAGTLVGTVISDRIVMSTTQGGGTTAETLTYNFGGVDGQPMTLNGTSQVLAVNFNGQNGPFLGTANLSCTFIWTEE